MKKTEKVSFVENLTEELKTATSVVLVDYTGLSVKSQQELKKRLSVVGAQMSVVKNTLFKISGKQAELSNDLLSDTTLSGPTAMIVTESDPIAPLQVLARFAKEFEIPYFKVGIVEGMFQDKESLEKLAVLPSKELLLGQVVGSIASPMYGIVGVLRGNLQKLVWILNAKIKTLS